jgi:hypothetical protein
MACESGPCAPAFGPGASEPGRGESGTAVEITGRAMRAMSPGTDASVNLQLTNRNAFAMSTRHLVVEIQKVTAPRSGPRRPCTSKDFTVAQAAPGLEIILPARGSTTLQDRRVRRSAWPRIAMVDARTNQDGCQQAVLVLHYTASGTKVEQ